MTKQMSKLPHFHRDYKEIEPPFHILHYTYIKHSINEKYFEM